MKRGSGNQIEVAAAASEVTLVDGRPARRVKLLPMGRISLRDGRGPFFLRDRAHAEQVVAATREYLGAHIDLNFDYDHQAKYASQGAGNSAPASGWARQDALIVEDDGIYCDVDWTPPAVEKMANREYRYLSPVFMAAKGSGDALYLKNVALLNTPAIDMPAIAAGLSGENDTMDLSAIAAALGLAATATAEEIAAAAASLKKISTGAIAVAAGLAENASPEEIVASVTALKSATPDPAKFVPVEQLTATNQRLNVLEGERAEQVVAGAIETGKLVPALKAWALEYFRKDEAGFHTWLGNQPVVVAAGAELGGRMPAKKATTLTAEEIAACEMTGMTHEDFLKAKNEEIA